MNLALILLLLQAASMILGNAASSTNTDVQQKALLFASRVVQVIQESGVLNPVTPVYEEPVNTSDSVSTDTIVGATSTLRQVIPGANNHL